MNRLRRIGKRTDRRGNIVPLAAVFLVVTIAFLAFSIDFGYIVVSESELQNAADSAAMSAARSLSDGREATITAAKTWAAKNIAAGEGVKVHDEDVELGSWDEDTATFTVIPPESKQSPDAVRVTCRRNAERGNPLSLFFAPIIGTENASLIVSAIAQNKGGACGGIMALEKVYLNDRQVGSASYTDSYNSKKGDYDPANPGDNGDICTNGHLTLNGNSFVNGDARWWEQANDPKATESQVSGVLESFEEQIEFPEIDPGNSATSNDNDSIPLSDNGFDPLDDGVFQLGEPPPLKKKKKKKKGDDDDDGGGPSNPNDHIELAPGTYYFKELILGEGATITITGPTYIYVEGTIDIRYGGIINVTKKPIDLQIYPMGEDTYFYLPFFGELHASIYSTKAHIYLDEKEEPVDLEFYGKMVGQKIRVWDTALHVDESISFGALESGGNQIGMSGVSLVQ
ncbi:MAG: hypothetical protein IH991_05660 [Planctomycetes bacterium]|nr:hypothetical protein [Planctomycetota bacterium]